MSSGRPTEVCAIWEVSRVRDHRPVDRLDYNSQSASQSELRWKGIASCELITTVTAISRIGSL